MLGAASTSANRQNACLGMTAVATQSVSLTSTSVVGLSKLVIRPDDTDYVVGRVETGVFVLLPPVGIRTLELLRSGQSIGDVEKQLSTEFGEDIDVAEFVYEILELGFVETIDHRSVAIGIETSTSLPRIQERHVAWLFSWPMKTLYLALIAAAATFLFAEPDLLPRYSDFFWNESTSLVIAVNTVFFLAAITAHEIAHLVAARSLGAPARITLSTRLFNLVAQTDISGLWSLPRSKRYRGYLAGIAWDAGLIALIVVTVATVPLTDTTKEILSAVVLMLSIGIASQCQLYMRTDLYFVLADLFRARNLFEDATMYAGYSARRLMRLIKRPSAIPQKNPLSGLMKRERRVVVAYARFMVGGTIVALTVFVLFIAPVIVVLLIRATERIGHGLSDGDPVAVIDGMITWAIEGGLQLAFIIVFVKTRSRWYARLRRRWEEAA